MKIIDTSQLEPQSLFGPEREWVYNGLDCCVTAEVLDVLLPQLSPQTQKTYEFSKSLQGPVLDMGRRGVLIDAKRKEELLQEYWEKVDKRERWIERMAKEAFGIVGFNWRSPADLQRMFYDKCRFPVITTKEGRTTVNRSALEKIEKECRLASYVIRLITESRELTKRMEALNKKTLDGRMRTSYNIAGTVTGRFSSSWAEFGDGGNMQNIEEGLRSIFISDPGMKMATFDAEQGESRCVGAIEWNLFKDDKYLNSCQSGDLHTVVSRLCEPDYGWTGDLIEDRKIAEKPYYRHHDLRKLCKSIGHGTNYGGQPNTLSRMYKVEVALIAEFQKKYFKAFPAHRMWHAWVENQIRSVGHLTSLTGRLRHFFGRRDSPDTYRQALDFDPQCSLSDIVNAGMLKVWLSECCELLIQGHDSITVQYHEEQEDDTITEILSYLYHELTLKHNRTMTIPYGIKTGWNWGSYSATNPDGLKAYRPGDKRTRQSPLPKLD